jgi:3-deoxy-manno-octulosonate cytidylyltransferase (CMP-KDO synthetase)
MKRIVGIIPARYGSSRFPGKPLAIIGGKPMIQHVYEQVSRTEIMDRVIVATDDERIADAVKSFQGEVVMTSSLHVSGTDRCLEAYEKLGEDFDLIVNIQGDEPFVSQSILQDLIRLFDDEKVSIGTLSKKINTEEALSENKVKVVFDKYGKALYFSRSRIPYGDMAVFYKHLGIYAYKPNVLKRICQLDPSTLEQSERLEQLRWLENGVDIHVGVTEHESIAVDTPEDLIAAETYFRKNFP